MVVEADLTERHHLWMPQQLPQALESFGRRLGGIVRMYARRRPDEGLGFGQPDACLQIRRPVARAHGEHARYPGRERALDHLLAVFVEAFVVQVAVRIDQRHFRRAPTGMSSRNPASTGLPPSTEAATIMPFDSMPRSLRG